MSSARNANIGSAYDLIASDYDALMQPDLQMRQALWRHYARTFRAGDRVLDFGCGTGMDALHLARLGLRVTAIDMSPAMISQLVKKAEKERLPVEARVGTVATLQSLKGTGFAGIVSAFAALNTVPDLSAFATEAYRLLIPGGRLVAHFLARPGIWELLGCLIAGRLSEARERRRCREKIFAVCGEPVVHTLLPPRETYDRLFRPGFRLRALWSFGFLWPQQWDRFVPAPVARLGSRLEVVVGRVRPFSDWGRFFVLDLEARPLSNQN
jgi:ubiquinone/menaquinone biosynthesis C-methylase UbiE